MVCQVEKEAKNDTSHEGAETSPFKSLRTDWRFQRPEVVTNVYLARIPRSAGLSESGASTTITTN